MQFLESNEQGVTLLGILAISAALVLFLAISFKEMHNCVSTAASIRQKGQEQKKLLYLESILSLKVKTLNQDREPLSFVFDNFAVNCSPLAENNSTSTSQVPYLLFSCEISGINNKEAEMHSFTTAILVSRE